MFTDRLSYDQILEVLKSKLSRVQDFAHEDYDMLELGLGPIIVKEQNGGEDEGSNWNKVFYFEEHDVYIKIIGWYDSYDGCQFDGWGDCYEVRPKTKVITVYE